MFYEHAGRDQYLEPAGPGSPPQGLAEHMGVSTQLVLQQLLRCH